MKKIQCLGLLLCALSISGCKKTAAVSVEQHVDVWNQQLPKVVEGKFKFSKIDFSNNMLHQTITVLGWQTIRDDRLADAEKDLIHKYCAPEMKAIVDAGIGIEFTIETEPHSLDLHVDSVSLSVLPDKCN